MSDVLAWLLRFISGASVFWIDAPPDAAQRIYIANHTSHLDFVVLWSALPPPVRELARPVAARDYWEKGALRRYLARKVFRAVLVDRLGKAGETRPAAAARQTVENLLSEMGDRYSLIVFPEGTRGSGEEMAPFKSGLFHLCKARPGLSVVPVYLDNLNRVLPKGEALPVPMLSRVVFGRPFRLEPEEGKTQFLERARAAVAALRDL